MEPLKPLREYLAIEAWLYEDGGIGWKIKSNRGGEIDHKAMANILFEMAEHHAGDADTVIAFYFQTNGNIVTRRRKDLDIRSRRSFVWLRENLWRAQSLMRDKRDEPGWRKWLWSICFYLSPFRRSQKAPRLAAHSALPTPTEPLAEPFERVQNAAEEGPKVVPLRQVKRDD